MRKMKTKKGQEIMVPEKGERLPGAGRVAGTKNKFTTLMKDALLWGAANSIHSKDGSVESFCQYCADTYPREYLAQMGRLVPMQVNARVEQHSINKLIFESREETAAVIATHGLTDTVDAIVNNTWKKPIEILPTPVEAVEVEVLSVGDNNSTPNAERF